MRPNTTVARSLWSIYVGHSLRAALTHPAITWEAQDKQLHAGHRDGPREERALAEQHELPRPRALQIRSHMGYINGEDPSGGPQLQADAKNALKLAALAIRCPLGNTSMKRTK